MLHVNRALDIADTTSDVAVSVKKAESRMSAKWEGEDEVCTKFACERMLPTCLSTRESVLFCSTVHARSHNLILAPFIPSTKHPEHLDMTLNLFGSRR